MSAASWTGVRVMDVLARIDPLLSATRLLVEGFDEHSVPSSNGHSTPGASWIFSFEELEAAGAFFATGMNGEPLPADHGEPLRLLVPGWYGCSCIKWVNRLSLVDEDAPTTSQMREFASRTHQLGVPALARDYLPASMDQAAMPVRIEKWRDADQAIAYRVLGVMWGGSAPTDALVFEDGRGPGEAVAVCPPQTQNQLWTVWQHLWRPTSTGRYALTMRVDDPAVRTRRLDLGYYERFVIIDEPAG
jgi:DMSO/TMAO reductase YedYZ molybdopterin-dependent catalytic subunit